jgi:hypothetical protein
MRRLVHSADHRDVESANRLGCILRDGDYWLMNCARAAHYFKIAARAKHTTGMVNLGLMLESGQGLPSDPAQAADLFLQAHRRNDVEGTFHRARVLMHGLGVPKNEESARALYELAAERGHPGARILMGYPPDPIPQRIPVPIPESHPPVARQSSSTRVAGQRPDTACRIVHESPHPAVRGKPHSAHRERAVKVVLLGNSHAGKTALFYGIAATRIAGIVLAQRDLLLRGEL